MAKADLTAQRLRELLRYDPETGAFAWLIDHGTRIKAGQAAGHHRSDGYFDIRVDVRLHRAHRLAWLYMTGAWPSVLIDHQDRRPENTKWLNLRQATHSQNHQNQILRKDATHGVRGIELHESGLWRARLTLRGKRIHIGYFKTKEEAGAARIEAEKIHFTHSPACARPS